MKRLFILVVLFFITNTVYAKTPVDFLYINGSNVNDLKGFKWYETGIKTSHPTMKKQLEKDKFLYQYMFKNGEYYINDEPEIYFWGYKSQDDLLSMHKKIKHNYRFAPTFAYLSRNYIANVLHDVVWIQYRHNMKPITDDIHRLVISNYKSGHKTIMFGYSAGAFITFEYLYSRLPYINLSEWFKTKKTDKELYDIISNNPKHNTCIEAMFSSDMLRITPNGDIIPNADKNRFINSYKNMDNYTKMYCAPEDNVIGIINYANPIPLFYTGKFGNNTDSGLFFSLMNKYLIEHDFFLLTINFVDDPVSYPNGVNYSNKAIADYLNVNFDEENGFIYDYSKKMSWRTMFRAHQSYWSAKKIFSKSVINAYTEGYKFHYSNKIK